jgi:arylsulfatase A-like enzyme
VDLSATLLDLLGMPPPPEWDGSSLLGREHPLPVYLFAAGWGENLLGVRDGDWKYAFDARRGRDELYNVVNDPEEQHDLAKVDVERARRLRQRLAAWLRVDKGDAKQLGAGCP